MLEVTLQFPNKIYVVVYTCITHVHMYVHRQEFVVKYAPLAMIWQHMVRERERGRYPNSKIA